MKRFFIAAALTFAAALVLFAEPAYAFTGKGCVEGECKDCHKLGLEEAATLLKVERLKAKVTGVKEGPIKGIWEVHFEQAGKKGSIYVDYSKEFFFQGQFVPLERIGKPPELKKVDRSRIPLEDALVVGNKDAKHKIIVFDDPECPYCKKLHEEILKIVEEREDIVFFLKIYPLPIHPTAYEKARTIVCEKSVKLLEDAYDGKELPKADCETVAVDETIRLAAELGILGTPAIVLPNGSMIPGALETDLLLRLIDEIAANEGVGDKDD